MHLNLPDNASLDVVLKAYVLEVLRIHQDEAGAAKQIGVDRSTVSRWLEEWGIIVAYVQDGPNVIPARKRRKSRAARTLPSDAAASQPGGPATGFQATLEEARALRAAHERRRAGA